MEYFRIKNWDKYQHRDATRNGRMPWIKLFTSCLRDYKTQKMSPSEFGIWCRLLLITGETGNKLPLDRPYLRACLAPVKFKKALDLRFLWDLDLIEKWDASLDKDTDKTQTKTSARAQTSPKVGASAPTAGSSPLIGLWNQYTKGIKAKSETTKRLKAAAARWKEKPDEGYWISVIQKINENPWYLGENPSGWRADVDWFLRPDKHVKIAEGSLDSKFEQKKIRLR